MTSPINCLSILVIPLLVTSIFYQASVGQPGIKIDDSSLTYLCKNSTDPTYCFKTLKADPDTFAGIGDKFHLGIVSIAIVNRTVSATAAQIPRILEKLSDRVDKIRMMDCKDDYNVVLDTVGLAYVSSDSRDYYGAMFMMQDAASRLGECKNSYTAPPVRASPIADGIAEAFKKFNIVDAVFGYMLL
ncbi:pectinesterase inhibitor [Quercus suber]|uniref:Pectinesterase inhibitor n=1 Tax=Quercus suber TaxID=58331 RepID=A0AAW0KC84_QUESU|nr:uncharacterized protein LOC112003516 [Quercus suber]XP_023894271.1 uncharacterized protein LOC112006207 [Quercus suber]POE58630.1 pectinesterase inhibitor [Quercus suber]POE61886.1 pectinesterase inhibitor [Quercus suber]